MVRLISLGKTIVTEEILPSRKVTSVVVKERTRCCEMRQENEDEEGG
jgi:hypothetical protein